MTTPHAAARPTGPALDVVVESARWTDAGLEPEALAREGVAAAAAELGTDDERPVAVVFADDELIAGLNARYRQKPSPTNVLAFPFGDLPVAVEAAARPLGDVVLAFETIAREADELGLDLRARALHMVVHGYLHLRGYDHAVEDDARKMESMERKSLARLGVADPYEVRDHA